MLDWALQASELLLGLLETIDARLLALRLETVMRLLVLGRITVDARLLILVTKATGTMLVNLGIRLRAVDVGLLRSKLHDRSLVVLNTSHVVIRHESTANRWKFSTLIDSLNVLDTRGAGNIVVERGVETIHRGSTIDTLITLWLESIETSNLSTKLGVLQAKSICLTARSLGLLRYHRNGVTLLNKLTLQSLMLRNSYEVSACYERGME